jgi:hypothetical protein
MNCEWEHGDGKRCRRKARYAVVLRCQFGTRCGPLGDEPVYRQKTVARCADHSASDLLKGRQVLQVVELERREPSMEAR